MSAAYDVDRKRRQRETIITIAEREGGTSEREAEHTGSSPDSLSGPPRRYDGKPLLWSR